MSQTTTADPRLIPDIETFEERVAIMIHDGGIPTTLPWTSQHRPRASAIRRTTGLGSGCMSKRNGWGKVTQKRNGSVPDRAGLQITVVQKHTKPTLFRVFYAEVPAHKFVTVRFRSCHSIVQNFNELSGVRLSHQGGLQQSNTRAQAVDQKALVLRCKVQIGHRDCNRTRRVHCA